MGFDRKLGLLDCVVLSLGGMVGSAIFIFPGSTGRLAGPAAVGAWFLAGVLMLAIALCYTELSLAFPRTGAPAVFPYETLGPLPSIRAFASYLEGVGYAVGWVFGLTISALAIADYLALVFPAASGYTTLIALVALSLAGIVNLLGVDITSRTNLLLSAGLLAILTLFVAAGAAQFQPRNYEPLLTGGPLDFFAATQVAMTAYGAWTVIPSAIEEIRNPARTVPRAIVLSLVIATVLYTGVVAAVHGVVAPARFTEGSLVITAPLRVAADAIGVAWLEYLLAVAALVAIFTTLLVGIMGSGRVLFALGDNHTLPERFATTSEQSSTPWVGIVAVTVLAGVLASVPQYFSQLLVIAAVVGTGIPYAINILSFIGLRYYRTDVSPSFRAPGGYALPVLAFIALGITMFGLGITEITWSIGAVVLLSGYFFLRAALHEDVLQPPETRDTNRSR
jgi:APA family basic amino acid/polyamine antiporter